MNNLIYFFAFVLLSQVKASYVYQNMGAGSCADSAGLPIPYYSIDGAIGEDPCKTRCDGDIACSGYTYQGSTCFNYYVLSRLTVFTDWTLGPTIALESLHMDGILGVTGSNGVCMKKLNYLVVGSGVCTDQNNNILPQAHIDGPIGDDECIERCDADHSCLGWRYTGLVCFNYFGKTTLTVYSDWLSIQQPRHDVDGLMSSDGGQGICNKKSGYKLMGKGVCADSTGESLPNAMLRGDVGVDACRERCNADSACLGYRYITSLCYNNFAQDALTIFTDWDRVDAVTATADGVFGTNHYTSVCLKKISFPTPAPTGVPTYNPTFMPTHQPTMGIRDCHSQMYGFATPEEGQAAFIAWRDAGGTHSHTSVSEWTLQRNTIITLPQPKRGSPQECAQFCEEMPTCKTWNHSNSGNTCSFSTADELAPCLEERADGSMWTRCGGHVLTTGMCGGVRDCESQTNAFATLEEGQAAFFAWRDAGGAYSHTSVSEWTLQRDTLISLPEPKRGSPLKCAQFCEEMPNCKTWSHSNSGSTCSFSTADGLAPCLEERADGLMWTRCGGHILTTGTCGLRAECSLNGFWDPEHYSYTMGVTEGVDADSPSHGPGVGTMNADGAINWVWHLHGAAHTGTFSDDCATITWENNAHWTRSTDDAVRVQLVAEGWTQEQFNANQQAFTAILAADLHLERTQLIVSLQSLGWMRRALNEGLPIFVQMHGEKSEMTRVKAKFDDEAAIAKTVNAKFPELQIEVKSVAYNEGSSDSTINEESDASSSKKIDEHIEAFVLVGVICLIIGAVCGMVGKNGCTTLSASTDKSVDVEMGEPSEVAQK